MQHLGRRPLTFGLRMAAKAAEERGKHHVREEWLAQLPWMTEKTFKPFEQFYQERTLNARTPLIKRSREEILAEVEAIRRKAAKVKRRTA